MRIISAATCTWLRMQSASSNYARPEIERILENDWKMGPLACSQICS